MFGAAVGVMQGMTAAVEVKPVHVTVGLRRRGLFAAQYIIADTGSHSRQQKGGSPLGE
jgi:hypothetical protein